MDNKIIYKDINPIRIDIFLTRELNKSRSFIKKIFDENKILLNDKIVTKLGQLLKFNDEIKINLENNTSKSAIQELLNWENLDWTRIKIIYEDNYFLIIDKPKNILVYPDKFNEEITIAHYIKKYFTISNIKIDFNELIRMGIVHRLDKDTTGALLIAKNQFVYEKLKNLFYDNKIKKEYICLVNNCFNERNKYFKLETMIGRSFDNTNKMIINGGKNQKIAVSIITVIRNISNKYSLVNCELITGRTHQIRAHMKYINHPIINDPVYGIEKKPTFLGQYLHCYSLIFNHPILNKKIEINLDIPEYFKDKINKLEYEK